jgi:nucleoside 2-deoxyribosyltransferase
MRGALPEVYLAGPMVFWPDADAVFAEMKAILAGVGLSGVAPVDNQASLEGIPPGRPLARAIYEADEAIMRRVDAALFCVDPFRRGTEMDAGTAFEVGYCRALGLPMAGWTTDGRSYREKVTDFMARAFGETLAAAARNASGATSGALRDADGVLVHSDGMVQNLMIEMAIEAGGGKVLAGERWQDAFTAAARHLGRIAGAA